MTAVKSVKIEVVSDVVCPWCYIGKRRLDNAIALTSDVTVELHWRPYLLERRVPREGMSRDDFVKMHFGSVDGYRQRSQALVEAASAEGLVYRPGLITRQPNTIDCHRLIHWAGRDPERDKSGQMKQRLMDLFMKEGGDLTDMNVLVKAAADCGMDAAVIRARLATDEDVNVIEALSRGAFAQGINGIPTYIFADRYEVPGAQVTAWVAAAIRQVSAELNGGAAG